MEKEENMSETVKTIIYAIVIAGFDQELFV